MNILNVVGARPNFVKIAPLMAEMRRHPAITATLVHTGQHYDTAMSKRFFDDLEISAPDVDLGVGSASHAAQTAEVMKRIEPVLHTGKLDMVVVVGDVNSTLGAALTASKLGIAVAHVEAGLRSFDRTMPEELNRILTDAIADLLFVTEESGRTNLLNEGVAPSRIHMVGNVMIDALESSRARWQSSDIGRRLGLTPDTSYAVLTLHRPSNTDEISRLDGLLEALSAVARHIPIVFPLHPRTRQQLERHHRPTRTTDGGRGDLIYVDPLGYLDFIALMARARLVLTDSGGIQEETTVLGVPCLTLRENTERPVTVSHGTNRVVGTDPQAIVDAALSALRTSPPPLQRPPFWDGKASARIVDVLLHTYVARAARAGLRQTLG
jgi:UDP-N-acetylglucosamine 2-epimerase (non-hydrolysing)